MQDIFDFIAKFVSRPDQVLMDFIAAYGYWIYAALFFIIFAETGLIIASFLMPFLPGDALIFAIGMIAANDQQNHLHIHYIIPLLMVAAILGDNVNYYVGRKFGNWLLQNPGKFYIKPSHINKATQFFAQHGKKAIIIARFMPVVRTIIPFICGTTKVDYKTFLVYSLIGAFLWVGIVSMLGYYLGTYEFVQRNLEYFIVGIIVAANMPLIIRLLRARFSKNQRI
ncbi:MAG: VTT domain-containing protein [Flavobacteriia bacterium]|nr:VTT domain-containing protein [Flavobacteriia bacterium]